MKSDQDRRRERWTLILIGFVCAVSLALPSAMTIWDDARLHALPVARPDVAGALSSRGRELPAAYELYRKRLLSGEEITIEDQPTDPNEASELLCEKTQALADARVLPEDVAGKILTDLAEINSAQRCSQDGVASVSCQQWGKEESSGQSHGWHEVQWLTSCGLVTSYSAAIAVKNLDETAVLEAYRAYLGLDVLTDWQTIGAAPDTNIAAVWSAEGQIYLYCSAEKNHVSLGAVSITEDSLPVS